VLIENFRPGTLERLGFGPERARGLNARLIYCSISGYGATGPKRDLPGYDMVIQGESGLMDVTGFPETGPTKVGVAITDCLAALYAVQGILIAHIQRLETGKGQFLDMAMYVAMSMHNYSAVAAENEEAAPATSGHGQLGPHHHMLFEAQDGWVMLSGASEHEKWERFFRHIGRADLNEAQKYLTVDVRPIVEGWSRHLPRAEVCRVMLGMEFSPAPVQSANDVYNCPQLAARDMFVEFEHLGRRFRVLGDPVKLSDVSSAPGRPPPLLGQHNDYVFGEIAGFSPADIQEMKAQGVF